MSTQIGKKNLETLYAYLDVLAYLSANWKIFSSQLKDRLQCDTKSYYFFYQSFGSLTVRIPAYAGLVLLKLMTVSAFQHAPPISLSLSTQKPKKD